MCFGEVAESLVKYRHGCIVLVLSPKTMKKNEKGNTFSLDSEQQVHLIGYSEDFVICKG